MGFGKNKTGVIIRENMTEPMLGLGDQAARLGTDLILEDDFRMLKTEVTAEIVGMTANEQEGLLFGICDGELTESEVAEVLALDGPVDRNDNLADERAMRPVWVLGVSDEALSGGDHVRFRGKLNAPIIEAKPRWTFSNPEGWDWFVFNNQGGALTTGGTFKVIATSYGVWVT